MSDSLTILRDLAHDKVESAVKELANARHDLQASLDRLQMIQGYVDQYQDGMQERAKQGVTAQLLSQQQQFITRLSHAVSQQQQDVSHKEHKVQTCLVHWQAVQAEEKKFQTLIDRASMAKALKENRRDQKNNDEYAARIHRTRGDAYL